MYNDDIAISRLRDAIDVRIFYPFTHMAINDDGYLLLKRYFSTRTLQFRISWEWETRTLRVFAYPHVDELEQTEILVHAVDDVDASAIRKCVPSYGQLIAEAHRHMHFMEVIE